MVVDDAWYTSQATDRNPYQRVLFQYGEATVRGETDGFVMLFSVGAYDEKLSIDAYTDQSTRSVPIALTHSWIFFHPEEREDEGFIPLQKEQNNYNI